MRTYERDTNYADLNHNDIREVRGYGPVHEFYYERKGVWESNSSSSSNKRNVQFEDLGVTFRQKPQPDDSPLNKIIEEAGPWIAKASLTYTAGKFLGPKVAFQVGGLMWGTTKIVEGKIEDENMKQVLQFIGDIGWDTAKGAFIGKLIGVGADSLASKTTQEMGHHVATKISANGGQIPSDVSDFIELGRIISACQKGYELKEKYEKFGEIACELSRHAYHKDEEKSYDSDCKVCKP